MERIRNVVVFGDSLSDIGIKWKTKMGKIAKATGQMTVNPTGRFSDCRNWADHMYEAATGQSLVKGSPQLTITGSKAKQSLKAGELCFGTTDDTWFRYANYAEGGACGGIPRGAVMKMALGQFKDQVKQFRKDYASTVNEMRKRHGLDITSEPQYNRTLFLVWFGANDLYTAGAPAHAMPAVAEKVANKRRNELAAITGNASARFIFMNLATPAASVRYLKQLESGEISLQELNNLATGANAYNARLKQVALGNGDGYVDVASVVSPENTVKMITTLGLTEGAQAPGTANVHVSSNVYDHQTSSGAARFLTTSDDAHPTDRLYLEAWKKIREMIELQGYSFGNVGPRTRDRSVSFVRPRAPEVQTRARANSV